VQQAAAHQVGSRHEVCAGRLLSCQGRVSERYESYAEARQCVKQLSADSLVGLAFIFQQLPDGSERLVREDGKPLQFHRRLVEEASGPQGAEGKIRFVEPQPPEDGWDGVSLA
jgi:hypothetical protein